MRGKRTTGRQKRLRNRIRTVTSCNQIIKSQSRKHPGYHTKSYQNEADTGQDVMKRCPRNCISSTKAGQLLLESYEIFKTKKGVAMFLDFLKLEFEKPDSSVVFNNGPKVNIEELKRINFVLGDSIGFSYKGIYHEFVVEHKCGDKAYFVSKLPLEESGRSELYDTLSEIREHFPTGLVGIMARTANEMSGEIYRHDNIFIPSIKNVGVIGFGKKFYKGDDTRYKRFADFNNRRKDFSWWVDDFLESKHGIKVNTYGMATYANKDETCGVVVAFAIGFEPMRT